jgi:hypothetical protein
LEEPELANAIFEESEGQTLLHVLAFIDHLSPKEKLILSHLEGERIVFMKVVIKIVSKSIKEF